jgi:hypothetical protein
MAKLRTTKRQSNAWFYGILVLLILVGYVLVQFGLFATKNCTGERTWEWKLPPGFVCTAPEL